MLVLDTARFKYPPFWVHIDSLYNSLNSVDSDNGKMRGIIVLSKKDTLTFGERDLFGQPKFGISINEIMPSSAPKVKTITDLTTDQLHSLLATLNSDSIKVHLFKFLHDLFKFCCIETKEIKGMRDHVKNIQEGSCCEKNKELTPSPVKEYEK